MDYQRKKKDMVSTIYDNKAGREATPTLHSYILKNYYYYADFYFYDFYAINLGNARTALLLNSLLTNLNIVSINL